MIRRQTRFTRTDPLFPDTPLFRSTAVWCAGEERAGCATAGTPCVHASSSSATLILDVSGSVRYVAGRKGTSQPARIARSACGAESRRSEEHTSELQSLMHISYAVFCLQKKKKYTITPTTLHT